MPDDEKPPVTTMRRIKRSAAPMPSTDDADDVPKTWDPVVAPPPPVEEDDDEVDVPTIRGGWTEGQQVMDSTSTFAQALKLDEKIIYIIFLDEMPYANYRRHWIERPSQSGQRVNMPFICLETIGRDCPLCDVGDHPQAVSSFNVALIGDDGQLLLKSWDVGARLFQVLKTFNADRKIGPLTNGAYAVNRTGKKQNVQYNVTPIFANRLQSDYGIPYPTPAAIAKLRAAKYDTNILRIPKVSELKEIAAELADSYD